MVTLSGLFKKNSKTAPNPEELDAIAAFQIMTHLQKRNDIHFHLAIPAGREYMSYIFRDAIKAHSKRGAGIPGGRQNQIHELLCLTLEDAPYDLDYRRCLDEFSLERLPRARKNKIALIKTMREMTRINPVRAVRLFVQESTYRSAAGQKSILNEIETTAPEIYPDYALQSNKYITETSNLTDINKILPNAVMLGLAKHAKDTGQIPNLKNKHQRLHLAQKILGDVERRANIIKQEAQAELVHF